MNVRVEAGHRHLRAGHGGEESCHLARVRPGQHLVLGEGARQPLGQLPPPAPRKDSAAASSGEPGSGPSPHSSEVTRFATTPATGIPSFRSRSWKKSASSTDRGLAEETSTKPTSGCAKSARTTPARDLNPSYMPWKLAMNSARSESTSAPVKRAMVFAM